MESTLLKNAIANIVAKIWSVVSLYIFVPLWIHFLGVEGYGVISFYAILMTLMAFADAGLSATLTREFAKIELVEGYKRDLLKTIESVYFAIAILVGLIIYILAPYITIYFLKSETIDAATLTFYVRIMAPILSLNFLYMLYTGGLMGLQRQLLANTFNIGYSILRGIVVLFILYVVPTVDAFLYWQLFSIVVITILSRYYLGYAINRGNKVAEFRFSYLKNVWKYALGMMAMAIISSLNTQLDKLIVGNLLSIKEMGFYSLASTLGQAVLMVTTPLSMAFYPELTRLISLGDDCKIIKSFNVFTFIVSALSSCVGLTLFFFIDDIATLWVSSNIASVISHPARILIFANIFLSLQYSVYYLAIAHGHTKTNVYLGAAMLIFTAPSVYFLTDKIGLMGAAIPYLFLNLLAAIYLGVVIMNKYLKGYLFKWMFYTYVPVLICLILIGGGYFLINSFIERSILRMISGGAVIVVTSYILLLFLFRFFPFCYSYSIFKKISVFLPNNFIK